MNPLPDNADPGGGHCRTGRNQGAQERTPGLAGVIVRFAACCRSFGLRVSTSEVLDCTRQMVLVNPLDETEFKTVVMANFVKSRRRQGRFNYVYQLFFHGIRPEDPNLDDQASLAEHCLELTSEFRNEARNDRVAEALLDFLDGSPAAYLAVVHDLNTREERLQAGLKSNLAQLSLRLGVSLTIDRLKTRLLTLAGNRPGQDAKQRQGLLEQRIRTTLETARSLLSHEPRDLNPSLKQNFSSEPRFKRLGVSPFSSLTPEEEQEVRQMIQVLVRKLKDQVGRRQARKNRGAIDIKKTLRQSAKFQGVPLDIQYRDKPPRKSSIVVLCDVSGSVWSAARFMLTILYSLQECFSRVKSYVFVSGLAEVTDLFGKGVDIDTAINGILDRGRINLHAPTDYGAAFQAFKTRYLQVLDRKTTVIIMGDGRSNYQNPQGGILGEIREKSRRIIWLNPEPAATWGTGDSEMFTYRSHCHDVRTCMNLNDLVEFVEGLVL